MADQEHLWYKGYRRGFLGLKFDDCHHRDQHPVYVSGFRKGKEDKEMCECKTRKVCADELLSEFCIECGRIWVNTLQGGYRPTDRFVSGDLPLNSCVWIGHVSVKDVSGQLAKHIGASQGN